MTTSSDPKLRKLAALGEAYSYGVVQYFRGGFHALVNYKDEDMGGNWNAWGTTAKEAVDGFAASVRGFMKKRAIHLRELT